MAPNLPVDVLLENDVSLLENDSGTGSTLAV